MLRRRNAKHGMFPEVWRDNPMRSTWMARRLRSLRNLIPFFALITGVAASSSLHAEQTASPMLSLIEICTDASLEVNDTHLLMEQSGWRALEANDLELAIQTLGDGHLFSTSVPGSKEAITQRRISERSEIGSRAKRRNSAYFYSKTYTVPDGSRHAMIHWSKQGDKLICFGSTNDNRHLDLLTDKVVKLSDSGDLSDVGPAYLVRSSTEHRPRTRVTLSVTKPSVFPIFQLDPLKAIAGLTILHSRGRS